MTFHDRVTERAIAALEAAGYVVHRPQPPQIMRSLGESTAATKPKVQGFVWVILFAIIMLAEGIGIAGGGALSDYVRIHVRYTPVGRFVLIPAWTWLTWHLMTRPRDLLGFTWRDALAIAIGFGLAYLAQKYNR